MKAREFFVTERMVTDRKHREATMTTAKRRHQGRLTDKQRETITSSQGTGAAQY